MGKKQAEVLMMSRRRSGPFRPRESGFEAVRWRCLDGRERAGGVGVTEPLVSVCSDMRFGEGLLRLAYRLGLGVDPLTSVRKRKWLV